ncbi:hypothetical protein [Ferrovum myxofaciens]|uniref:Uncharacterized protein n=1 Tax=Ferrovum myxofaciens TaxID=416213 RepID=A0A9E6MZ25_9PROT|nr:hypothetical protein [Ferrovum myxofaciens]QKE37319.1 MAG: hypothetical protein HO273_00080 [Ferrovum myxofaciens]QWY74965.1 MAG: hypothetical protein JVY19_00535 [Ferrovum myxofaciens]QWY77712.1 MAG: hypothetical protein JZL65_01085 [Ferrovum myxofaciens]
MSKTISSDTRIKTVRVNVELMGTRDIMFDRYSGDNKTQLMWWQKIYTAPKSNVLTLPATNIASLLTAINTNSAPKRLRDKRNYKSIANAILSFTNIMGPEKHPDYIPFMRDGKEIHVGAFGLDEEPESRLYLHRSVARLEKGIPNPKERPVLPLPWSLAFTLEIYQNQEIKEQEIKNLIEQAGTAIGLGTFRGVYGKYMLAKWE